MVLQQRKLCRNHLAFQTNYIGSNTECDVINGTFRLFCPKGFFTFCSLIEVFKNLLVFLPIEI